MMKKCYILSLLLCVGAGQAFAQEKTDRDYMRSGNKLYNDSLFIKAEVDYRKALELNPKSTDAMFNLGNALLMQQKAQEAMEQFQVLAWIVLILLVVEMLILERKNPLFKNVRLFK